jgi:hypothetical protein
VQAAQSSRRTRQSVYSQFHKLRLLKSYENEQKNNLSSYFIPVQFYNCKENILDTYIYDYLVHNDHTKTMLWTLDNGQIYTYIHLFLLIHTYYTKKQTQTQYKQICSCTQMFPLCRNRTRDLLRCRYSDHYAKSAVNIYMLWPDLLDTPI